MSNNQPTPRIRQLLRQAERVANLDKRLAARQLYEQILEEAPHTAEAWLALGKLSTEPTEQTQALSQALQYDPSNEEARSLLSSLTEANPDLTPEFVPQADNQEGTPESTLPAEIISPPKAAPSPVVAPPKPQGLPQRDPAQAQRPPEWEAPPKVLPARFDTAVTPPPAAATEATTCYRHPTTETSLRCNRCSKPICIKCAKRTSVGYRCPDCIYELEEKYYTGQSSDYLIALAVSVPLSFTAGVILTFFGFNIWILFFVFIIAGGVGSVIARITARAIGRRRSRYLPQMVAAVVAVGAIAPALAMVIINLAFGVLNPFPLILPGIFAFVAASAAYYQMR